MGMWFWTEWLSRLQAKHLQVQKILATARMASETSSVSEVWRCKETERIWKVRLYIDWSWSLLAFETAKQPSEVVVVSQKALEVVMYWESLIWSTGVSSNVFSTKYGFAMLYYVLVFLFVVWTGNTQKETHWTMKQHLASYIISQFQQLLCSLLSQLLGKSIMMPMWASNDAMRIMEPEEWQLSMVVFTMPIVL